MANNLLTFTILVYLAWFAKCGQRVDIILSGRDIPTFAWWWWSEPDPYVKVFYKYDPSQNWINYGKTSTADNNPNPNWPEVFTFDYVDGSAQTVKYEVWDSNWFWDDLIGTLELRVGEIVKSAIEGGGMAVERHVLPAPNSGRVLMKVRIDGTIPVVPYVLGVNKHFGPLTSILFSEDI